MIHLLTEERFKGINDKMGLGLTKLAVPNIMSDSYLLFIIIKVTK